MEGVGLVDPAVITRFCKIPMRPHPGIADRARESVQALAEKENGKASD